MLLEEALGGARAQPREASSSSSRLSRGGRRPAAVDTHVDSHNTGPSNGPLCIPPANFVKTQAFFFQSRQRKPEGSGAFRCNATRRDQRQRSTSPSDPSPHNPMLSFPRSVFKHNHLSLLIVHLEAFPPRRVPPNSATRLCSFARNFFSTSSPSPPPRPAHARPPQARPRFFLGQCAAPKARRAPLIPARERGAPRRHQSG